MPKIIETDDPQIIKRRAYKKEHAAKQRAKDPKRDNERKLAWRNKNLEKKRIKQKRKFRYLFIQMEYCKTTLRAVIDEGNLWTRPVDIHFLFRQILEA